MLRWTAYAVNARPTPATATPQSPIQVAASIAPAATLSPAFPSAAGQSGHSARCWGYWNRCWSTHWEQAQHLRALAAGGRLSDFSVGGPLSGNPALPPAGRAPYPLMPTSHCLSHEIEHKKIYLTATAYTRSCWTTRGQAPYRGAEGGICRGNEDCPADVAAAGAAGAAGATFETAGAPPKSRPRGLPLPDGSGRNGPRLGRQKHPQHRGAGGMLPVPVAAGRRHCLRGAARPRQAPAIRRSSARISTCSPVRPCRAP